MVGRREVFEARRDQRQRAREWVSFDARLGER
jgi:hypothetical protein